MGTILINLFGVFAVALLAALALGMRRDKNLVTLELAPLGQYHMPNLKKTVDLSRYYVDNRGNLYSNNPYTYETDYGFKLLKCSDEAISNDGHIINSLRASGGKKVTLRRSALNFHTLKKQNGSVTIQGKRVSDKRINITSIL